MCGRSKDVSRDKAEGVAGSLPGLLSYMTAHEPRPVGNQEPPRL